ncbi:MAG: acyltransferase family protein [Phormidesmis sp.]
MEDRNLSIDIARGIAITSVVVGHVVPGITHDLIYLFHMPFFFIVSGHLHHLDYEEGRYLKRKCISLLVPYFSYLLLLRGLPVLDLFLKLVEHPSNASLVAFGKYTFRMLYGGEALTGTVGVFWFVTTLFLTQQLFNFIGVRIKDKRLILGITVALYGIALLDQITATAFPLPWGLPWNINVVCGAFVFYAIGSLYGDFIFKQHTKLLLFLAAMVSILAVILTVSGPALIFNMKLAHYGVFILSPLTAFSLTKILMYGSSFLARIDLPRAAISSVGGASITIMFAHRIFQYIPPGSLLERWPWLMAAVVTLLCYVLHQILLTNRFSRAFLLGSRRDFDSLIGKHAIL